MRVLQEGKFQVVYSLTDRLAESIIAFLLMGNYIQVLNQVVSWKQDRSQTSELHGLCKCSMVSFVKKSLHVVA